MILRSASLRCSRRCTGLRLRSLGPGALRGGPRLLKGPRARGRKAVARPRRARREAHRPATPRPPPSLHSRTPVLAPAALSTSSFEDVGPRRALPAQSGSPRPGAPQNAASSPATGRSPRELLLPACLRSFLTTPPRRHRDRDSSESESSCKPSKPSKPVPALLVLRLVC